MNIRTPATHRMDLVLVKSMSIKTLKIMLAVTLVLGATKSLAENQYVSVFLGQFDVGQTQVDTQYGVSWLSNTQWTRWSLQPEVGLLRTRYGSHLIFTGITRRTPFNTKPGGLALTVGLAPAIYWHGNGEDTDLGYWLQFKSSLGLEYEFPDATRIGASFSHLSNASLGETNPGTELWTLHFRLPF